MKQADQLTKNQTSEVKRLMDQMNNGKLSLAALEKQRAKLQLEQNAAQKAFSEATEVLKGQEMDAAIIRNNAVGAFNVSKEALLRYFDDTVKVHKATLDDHLKNIEEERQLVTLIRAKLKDIAAQRAAEVHAKKASDSASKEGGVGAPAPVKAEETKEKVNAAVAVAAVSQAG